MSLKVALLKKKAEKINPYLSDIEKKWPRRHIHTDELQPVPYHKAQDLISDSSSRIVVMSAGSQGGKTVFGPHWLWDEIYHKSGPGDYIAVTSSYDLFKLKMLPSMLSVFESIYGMGRFWGGDRIIELADPESGKFLANRSTDKMWGRIILRSADALSGLESATAKAAWLDECGQDRFTFDAYKAIRRRVALKRGRMLMTTTLYNIGWFTQHVIDPATAEGISQFFLEPGGEIELTVSDKKDTTVVQFDSTVNPSFSSEEFEEQRELLPDEEFQMFYRGRKAARRFLIYDSFDFAKHTVKPFPIPESWKRFIGMDFGGAHMCAMFYAEEPGTGVLYCYREYLSGNKTIEQHVKDILKMENGVPACYGGARGEDQWRTEFASNGLVIMPPATDDVDMGINRVYALHSAGAVIYFSNLSGILDEKGRYRRKRDSLGNATSDIEQKNTFHRLDAERYLMATIRPGTGLRMKVINLGETHAR